MTHLTAQSAGMVRGTTILLGDGSYFDYSNPDASGATIEDYAWGLASKGRFNGQTRLRRNGERCIYTVLQHVVLLCHAMIADGRTPVQCFEGLMHESDEVVGPDFASSLKPLLPADTRDLFDRAGAAFDRRFRVTCAHHALVKEYDVRMLATEKRDLMPHADAHSWSWVHGVEPFAFSIDPWSPERTVPIFLRLYRDLGIAIRDQAAMPTEPLPVQAAAECTCPYCLSDMADITVCARAGA